METPEFFHGGYYEAEFSPDKRLLEKNGDNFIVEELLDLPNDDGLVAITDGGALDAATADSSTVTALENSCTSSAFSGEMTCHHLLDGQFSSDFAVPYDDLAELEWLSNIVEEPFSSEDMEKMQLISGIKARNDEASEAQMVQPENTRANAVPMFRPDVSIPAKARSKRSRIAPGNWTSRILAVSAPATNTITTTTITTTATAIMPTPTISSSSESDMVPNHARKRMKATMKKKESSASGGAAVATLSNNSEGRRCLHCDTDKTPQWRTGPMGPKTLCNACGVRYKSGRLVPEYRPASSPTFVLTKHSNSHRKVMEIRRQKELHRAQHHQQQFLHQNMMFDVSNASDYLIHQHVGPDYRQLI
ncbi:PREDICTED: GATA transcription factor 12-like [Ipomoea nil]|uniref:GATA transcription factor 12-like n=1 Tax=Ipomoea nil TaxID=35883 RepID=UPI00090200F6|nr:PREDICTED: GATA transcription factor 12-like [Ipomoea nil]